MSEPVSFWRVEISNLNCDGVRELSDEIESMINHIKSFSGIKSVTEITQEEVRMYDSDTHRQLQQI